MHDMGGDKIVNMMDVGHPSALQQFNQQMGSEPISHYSQSASMNQSNSGLNKAFSKVLNTLNNDHINSDRDQYPCYLGLPASLSERLPRTHSRVERTTRHELSTRCGGPTGHCSHARAQLNLGQQR